MSRFDFGDLDFIFKVIGGHRDVKFSLKLRYLMTHWPNYY